MNEIKGNLIAEIFLCTCIICLLFFFCASARKNRKRVTQDFTLEVKNDTQFSNFEVCKSKGNRCIRTTSLPQASFVAPISTGKRSMHISNDRKHDCMQATSFLPNKAISTPITNTYNQVRCQTISSDFLKNQPLNPMYMGSHTEKTKGKSERLCNVYDEPYVTTKCASQNSEERKLSFKEIHEILEKSLPQIMKKRNIHLSNEYMKSDGSNCKKYRNEKTTSHGPYENNHQKYHSKLPGKVDGLELRMTFQL